MSAATTAERIVNEALADAILARRPGCEWMQAMLSRRAGARTLGLMVDAEMRQMTKVMRIRALYGVRTAERLRELVRVGDVAE